MSIVDYERCECDCHRTKGVMHIMPCCDGRCDICRKFIKRGKMEKHKETHEVVKPAKEE